MEREKLLPILSDLACKLFSLPATSVSSERIFSCAGNVVTEKWSRLLAHNVDQLVFLYEKSRCLAYTCNFYQQLIDITIL